MPRRLRAAVFFGSVERISWLALMASGQSALIAAWMARRSGVLLDVGSAISCQ